MTLFTVSGALRKETNSNSKAGHRVGDLTKMTLDFWHWSGNKIRKQASGSNSSSFRRNSNAVYNSNSKNMQNEQAQRNLLLKPSCPASAS